MAFLPAGVSRRTERVCCITFPAARKRWFFCHGAFLFATRFPPCRSPKLTGDLLPPCRGIPLQKNSRRKAFALRRLF